MKKIITLLIIFLLFTSSFSNSNFGTTTDPASLTKTSIRTYINNTSIESWLINNSLYVAISDLERYGYDVIWIPKSRSYHVTFDNHSLENVKDLRSKSQPLTSFSLDKSWHHSWFETTYPISESIGTIHGLAHSYNRTNHVASITFKRTIPEAEINRENIRVYADGSFDVSPYFDYSFDTQSNTFYVKPNDDIIFKYTGKDFTNFRIVIDESLSDDEGNLLTIPIHHGFVLNEKYIKTEKRIPNQMVSLSPNSLYGNTPPHVLYRAENLNLIAMSELGASSRDDDEYIKRLYITPKVHNTSLSHYKRIDSSNYFTFITDVPVPDRNEYKTNGYATITQSASDHLATLSHVASNKDDTLSKINIISLQDNSIYKPLLNENALELPTNIDSGLYALTFDDDLQFEDENTLNENIYFVVYID